MSRDFLLAVRQAFLMMVDACERELGISPTTAELRREARQLPHVKNETWTIPQKEDSNG